MPEVATPPAAADNGTDALATMLGLPSDISVTTIREEGAAPGAGRIINFSGEQPKAADAAPAVETPAAEKPAAEGGAPAVPAAHEKEEGDIYDKALAALDDNGTGNVPLDDNTKAALKARGIEDLDAYVSEKASLAEQVGMYKAKAEAHDDFMGRLQTLPPEIGEAIEAHRKGEDYSKALLPLINGVSAAKEAKRIDKFALVDHYFPGKFNEEQKAAIKEGDTTLEGAFDLFHEQAKMKHDARREAFTQAAAQKAAAEKAITEKTNKAVADAIAHARADKSRAVLLDKKTLDAFQSGRLIDEMFYNEDGTPKPESLALALDAKHHKMLLERARKGAEAKGSAEGATKVMNKLAAGPNTAGNQKQQTVQQRGSEVDEAVRTAQDQIAGMLGLR